MESKLTEAQIAHIDKALKGIGIAYRDIRQEMIDHVATSLEDMEGDNFYLNLNHYMHVHKKELKVTNYRFVRRSKVEALKIMLRKMLTLQTAIVIAGAFAVIKLLEKYKDINESAFIIKRVNATIVAIPMMYYIFTNVVFRSKRFSGSDKLLGAMTGLTFLFLMPFKNTGIWSDTLVYEIYNAVGCGFSVALLITFIKLAKKYKLQYHA